MPNAIMFVARKRTARRIGLALLLIALVSPSTRADEALYARRCAGCHSDASALAARLSGRTTADVTANLQQFLTHHHMDDVTERSRLAKWLATLSHKPL